MDRKEKKAYKSPTLKAVTFKTELGVLPSSTIQATVGNPLTDDTPGLSDYEVVTPVSGNSYFSW